MDSISLTVPAGNSALLAAAGDFFARAAGIAKVAASKSVSQAVVEQNGDDDAPATAQNPAPAGVTEEATPETPKFKNSLEALNAAFESKGGEWVHVPDDPGSSASNQNAPAITITELDSAGLPWDQRIHSSSHKKKADGTWKRLRGVDDALVAAVEAELRQVMAADAPKPAAPAGAQPTGPEPTAPVSELTPEPTAGSVFAQQPAPPAAVEPAPANPKEPTNFGELIQAATAAGLQAQLPQVAADLGLPSLPSLAMRPDLVPQAWAKLTGA